MDEVEKLINDLTSARPQARTDAAFELGRRRDSRAVEPLIKALQQDDHEFVRAVAATALGKIRDKRAKQPLSEALKDPETAVANAAAEALRALEAPIEEPEIKQEVPVKKEERTTGFIEGMAILLIKGIPWVISGAIAGALLGSQLSFWFPAGPTRMAILGAIVGLVAFWGPLWGSIVGAVAGLLILGAWSGTITGAVMGFAISITAWRTR